MSIYNNITLLTWVIIIIAAKTIDSENATDLETDDATKKGFHFLIPKELSSLDIHFEFRPKIPNATITQSEVATETLPVTTDSPKNNLTSDATLPEVHSTTQQSPDLSSQTSTSHINDTLPTNTSTTPTMEVTMSEGITKPEVITEANSTEHSKNKTYNSPIGYEIPCGIRRLSTTDDRRIVNGTDAVMGEFPWLVSVQLKSGLSWRHICGGAVISRNFVVTAGHCIYKLPLTALTIVAGDYNLYKNEGHEQRSEVVRIIGRKGFVRDNFTEDIALLQLEPYLRMNSMWVAPICLPSPTQEISAGSRAIVAGWGRLFEGGTLPQVLQRVSLPIIQKNICDEMYNNSGFSDFLHQCQICSGWEYGGSDSCQGDSGGPLACKGEDDKYYLCGIVSWGVGCARPKFPGVYTQVSCYSQWIADVLYNKQNGIEQSVNLT